MTFCKYCIHWKEAWNRARQGRFGFCNEYQVNQKIVKDEGKIVEEDHVLYTNENFGCIYFRKKSLVVTEIKIDDD